MTITERTKIDVLGPTLQGNSLFEEREPCDDMIDKQIDQLVKSGQEVPFWSPLFQEFMDNVGKSKALHIVYNFPYGHDVTEDLFMNRVSMRAVRNRYRLAQSKLREMINQILISFPGEEVRILEVAAGSAQALLELMSKVHRQGIGIKALLLDSDPNALDHAVKLAEWYEVQDQIEVVRCNAFLMDRNEQVKRFRPHGVEWVGLRDYLSNKKALFLDNLIRELLLPGGWLLSANIMPNPEQDFLHKLLYWPKMVYRSREQLSILVNEAGYVEVRTEPEPLGHHCLITAQKKILVAHNM